MADAPVANDNGACSSIEGRQAGALSKELLDEVEGLLLVLGPPEVRLGGLQSTQGFGEGTEVQ